MEEMIDVLDEKTGEKTGEIVERSKVHELGIWHGGIRLLLVNSDKTKVLLQKRSEDKKLYPNTWDISVGGHISHGENDITTLERELKEELDININDLKFEKLEVVKDMINNNGVISNAFVSLFLAYGDVDINDIKLQLEEVSEVKWCNKEELNELIKNKTIIPHIREYEILNEILK